MKKAHVLATILTLVLTFLMACDTLDDAGADADTTTLTSCSHEICEWVVSLEPTCIESGLNNLVCHACGTTISSVALPPNDHMRGEWIIDTNATCTENGSKHQSCSVCEEIITTELIPAKHIEGEWIIDTDATCTEDGSQHQMCSVCNESIATAAVPAKGAHTMMTTPAVDPTCTAAGLTEGRKCSLCEFVSFSQKTLPALGHVSGKWITDSNATCTDDGLKHQVCSVCKEIISVKIITSTGHMRGEWIIDTNATCTENGSKHQSCSVCEEIITTELIPAKHIEGEWIIDTDATCTEGGSQHQICSVCNESIAISTISAKGHTYEFSALESNGTAQNAIVYKCTTCSDTYVETVDPLSVLVSLQGASTETTTNGIRYGRSFSVSVTGGYGKYAYKYEVFSSISNASPSLTQEFSTKATFGYSGNSHIDSTILKVTVMDEVGNVAIYRVYGSGDFIDLTLI